VASRKSLSPCLPPVTCRALVQDRTLRDRERRAVAMRIECRVISVDLVRENLRIFAVWPQDFELQGSRLILQATRFMLLQQRQELIPTPCCELDCCDDRKFWHVHFPHCSRFKASNA